MFNFLVMVSVHTHYIMAQNCLRICVSFSFFNFAAINDKLLQQLVSSSMKKAQWLFFCYCRGITVKTQSKSHHFYIMHDTWESTVYLSTARR